MLGGLFEVEQASLSDCLLLDALALEQNGLCSTEVDIGGCEIVQALVVAVLVIMLHEGSDLSFELTRKVIVLEQDAVLERLMPALDLALGLGMTWRSPEVLDLLFLEPLSEIGRDVAGAII